MFLYGLCYTCLLEETSVTFRPPAQQPAHSRTRCYSSSNVADHVTKRNGGSGELNSTQVAKASNLNNALKKQRPIKRGFFFKVYSILASQTSPLQVQ